MKTFNRLVTIPGLYDGLHFAHLRTGSRLADRMDRASRARLVPALRAELQRQPADLVLSVFATGASAAARLKAEVPGLQKTVVLCTDVAVHRIWAADGTDLFLVTSAAAAASVRRYLPPAQVAVVPPPVRPDFYAAPSQEQARKALGVSPADLPSRRRYRRRLHPCDHCRHLTHRAAGKRQDRSGQGGSLLPARHMSHGRLSRRPRGYDVDASFMSFQLHDRGIHTICEAVPGAADTRPGMTGGPMGRTGPAHQDLRDAA
jgi:Monogalactosyldiacylglycerol (MGDG) synthase